MKLGRVTGRVVSTQKLECFEGIKLLLVQPLNRDLEPTGDVIVAMDVVQAGQGDLIYYESSKEAPQALLDGNWFHPGDVAIFAIIDDIEDIRDREDAQ